MEEKKVYYSIGEFAKKVGVKEYVLRYWESVFPQLKPLKTVKGHRRYTEEHVHIVNYIKELMWEKKYTIEGAVKALSEYLSKRRNMQFTLDFSSKENKKFFHELKAILTELLNILQSK